MSLSQSPLIEVRRIPGKGRGVVAREFIPADTVIERCPVLVVKEQEIDESILMSYVYCWGRGTVAVALGYGSLYNHSYEPNAYYEDVGQQTKVFTAIRDIEPGEEITINYNGEPENKTDVGFPVLERVTRTKKKTASRNGKSAGSNGRASTNGKAATRGKKSRSKKSTRAK